VPPARTVADAAEAFLARATAPTTRRSYAQTMRALTPAYGDRLLDALDGPAVAALAAHSWGRWRRLPGTGSSPRCAHSPCSAAAPAGCRSTCAPAWNGARKEPTAPRPSPAPRWSVCSAARTSPSGRSACGGCCMRQPPARRKFSPSTSRTSTWTTSGPGRSPKAVTSNRCIFSPAPPACCPASSPDVRPGRCSSPIADRRSPIADRRPAPARTPAALDVCPVTGRGRLSYERAEYLFKRHSRRISRNGLTLHQLRHSALTTLADANVSLPLPMGKSRHKSLRSLQRYVHPSAEAVAAMTAAPTTPPPGVVGSDKQQDHPGLGLVTGFLPAPLVVGALWELRPADPSPVDHCRPRVSAGLTHTAIRARAWPAGPGFGTAISAARGSRR